jgi:uncharacterized delta-60 repeat protein
VNPIVKIDNGFNLVAESSAFTFGAGSQIWAVKELSNGNIIVGGYQEFYQGYLSRGITMLNPDLSRNLTFDSSPGFSSFGDVREFYEEADGSILCAGSFFQYRGQSTAGDFIRINTFGLRDDAFETNLGSGSNGFCWAVEKDPDASIFVGGTFSTFDGDTHQRICKINGDGTPDVNWRGTGFSINDDVNTIAAQDDGKIVAGGEFTLVDGSTYQRIVRFNVDGTIDSTFNVNPGFNQEVEDIKIDSEGRIVVVGLFTTYNGDSVGRIAVLDTDGNLIG